LPAFAHRLDPSEHLVGRALPANTVLGGQCPPYVNSIRTGRGAAA
jgi:hypothetical protein